MHDTMQVQIRCRLRRKDLPGETEIPEDEKELYAKLKTLQMKLDNIELKKKANKEEEKLSGSIEKAMKPKKEPSTVKGRTAKLLKTQQEPELDGPKATTHKLRKRHAKQQQIQH